MTDITTQKIFLWLKNQAELRFLNMKELLLDSLKEPDFFVDQILTVARTMPRDKLVKTVAFLSAIDGFDPETIIAILNIVKKAAFQALQEMPEEKSHD